jgi:hypothetical protein
MRLTPEEKTAQSLNKEYCMLKKYAERPGAPKLESDYYNKMAWTTSAKIDWRLLKPHKKNKTEDESEETYGIKESRNRFYK